MKTKRVTAEPRLVGTGCQRFHGSREALPRGRQEGSRPPARDQALFFLPVRQRDSRRAVRSRSIGPPPRVRRGSVCVRS